MVEPKESNKNYFEWCQEEIEEPKTLPIGGGNGEIKSQKIGEYETKE
jgi:hypothetical protein